MRGSIPPLIGRGTPADKSEMRRDDRDAYQAWLVGELLLVGLLGAALALFLAYPDLRTTYELPDLRLVLDTGIVLAATIVAVLAGTRFSVEGRRLDLLLCRLCHRCRHRALLRSLPGARRRADPDAGGLGGCGRADPRSQPDRGGGVRAGPGC